MKTSSLFQDLRLLKTHNKLSRGFLAYLAFSTFSHSNSNTTFDVNFPLGLIPSPIERFMNFEAQEYIFLKTIKYPLLNALLIYCRAKQSLNTSDSFKFDEFKKIEFNSQKYTLGQRMSVFYRGLIPFFLAVKLQILALHIG